MWGAARTSNGRTRGADKTGTDDEPERTAFRSAVSRLVGGRDEVADTVQAAGLVGEPTSPAERARTHSVQVRLELVGGEARPPGCLQAGKCVSTTA